MSNILLVANTSYAGMGPYVASIVNSFTPEDNVIFFLVEREDKYYTNNIRSELIRKARIIKEKTPSKIDTLCNITMGGEFKYKKSLLKIIEEDNVNLVHDLTGITDYKLVKEISEQFKYIYTVHDLHPHEAKKAFYKEWRQNVYYKRTFKAIDNCKYLLTNSRSQLNEQLSIYPKHRSFYVDFPSLMTDKVINGKKIPLEIIGEKDYILFFGRIEEYKGLDILINAYHKSSISSKIKLVIAGKGEFNIDGNKDNIIFINRYIGDDEISWLYKNSSCVIYPYKSATQSGVLSVASYFGTPIIASDLPFFREVLGDDYKFLFRSSDENDLALKIDKFFINKKVSNELSDISLQLYKSKYDISIVRNELMTIYNQILSSH